MKISADTNVLVRAVLQDDESQSRAAVKVLEAASLIAISLPCLCELVWVLLRGARLSKEEVAAAIQALIDTRNVSMNRPAAEAGLSMLVKGGDFADGVIAHEGYWLGGETFVSFDKKAVSLILAEGQQALLLR